MADNTDLQLAYSVLDTEGKGEITYHGLESLFKSLGQDMKPKELEEIFRATFELANKQGVKDKGKAIVTEKRPSSTKKGDEEEPEKDEAIKKKKTEDIPAIDWATFTAIMGTPIEEDEVKKIFKILDTSGSGTIAVSDLTQMLEVLTDNSEKLSESQLQSLLSLGEVKDNQKITFEQFKKWWV